MVDEEAMIRTLDTFRTLGVRLTMDDFGPEYSSLSHLCRRELDVLDVDPEFMAPAGSVPE